MAPFNQYVRAHFSNPFNGLKGATEILKVGWSCLACPEAYATASLRRRDIIGPMSLLPGTRLGPYEVHSALGAGGMGEVYRARDTKLGRDVALKIIPESWASDSDRLARFQREAQMLALLNHPHIAAIYGFEESTHPPALVLELVEGPTLADRIEQGPIPVEDALPIARQIADALEGAHERGIVHRDLKPANIKLRPDGTVKVLDFGLAKAVEPAAGTETAHSPTITSPAMTQLGTILGTAAYMSPEQAKGRAADKRSDIWAFGCVLFEMLAGVQVFAGDDVTDSIAAIVRAEPDWQKLPADTPPAIRRLLRRCLEKDPKERLTDIGVARLEIKDALATPFSEATPLARRASRRVLLPWIVAVTSLAASLALVAWSLRRDPVDLFPLRLEIVPPSGFWPNSVALSPDGKQLAFVAPVDGTPSLWVRRLDQETAQPVSGTKDAYYPFWSPDGRAIGFFAGGKLQRINLSGGLPQELADVTVGRGASWSRDDVILFAPSLDGGLMRVAATGGVPVAATTLTTGERNHRWPHFLPDGRHFLYGSLGGGGVYLASLDGGTATRMLESGSAAWYAFGYLISDTGGVLSAAQFDLGSKRRTGDSVTLLQRAERDGTGRSAATFSATGVFAYAQGSFGHRRLVWVDRTGKEVGTIGEPDDSGIANPELTIDGTRLAVTRLTQGPNVWIFDTARGVPTPLTIGPGNHHAPFWSPRGDRILFRSQTRGEGMQRLFVKPANGLSDAVPLFESQVSMTPSGWSPDGRFALYVVPGDDLMAVDLETKKSFPIAQTTANEGWGEISPDGRYVAYQSNETGRFEIHVRTFPGTEGKWVVSHAGGTQPRWRHDGRELYYIAPDNRLMAATLAPNKTGQTLDISKAVPLFRTNLVTAGTPGVLAVAAGTKQQYAVAPDGRFLMVVPASESTTASKISVVFNWPATLKR